MAVIGTNESTSREAWSDNHLGDAATLGLIAQQDDLIRQLVAIGKPVIVVLENGRPVAITDIIGSVKSVLEVWYPGPGGGTAVAEALFGDVNPGGKLPISVPRHRRSAARGRQSQTDVVQELPVRIPCAAVSVWLRPQLHDVPRRRAEARGPRHRRPGGRTTMSVRVTNTGAAG